MKRCLMLAAALLVCISVSALAGTITGRIINKAGSPVSGAKIHLNPGKFGAVARKGDGAFRFSAPAGRYFLSVSATGYGTTGDSLTVADTVLTLEIRLSEKIYETGAVTVTASKSNMFGIANLGAVEGAGIYEAKKTEVISLADVLANTATNNARQVFSKISGLNIWESDGAGLQLGVGGRGLSPNRTSNFNTRQNGYDISADALGYPESYYTPPVEALERIEIVRGAASLQYGTQFGGLLNFIFNKGAEDTPLEISSRQTIGSFGLFTSFNSAGGTIGNVRYYGFYQHKRGDGWRPNSGYSMDMGFVSAQAQPTDGITLGAEWTLMKYIAQQPGGLTDKQFADNPRQSVRSRNWFKVGWLMAALTAQVNFTPVTRLDSRLFGLLSSRESLGNLERINVADLGGNRTLIQGDFRNIGNETRLLHSYELFGLPANALLGLRIYDGRTIQRQGEADAGAGATFVFLHPADLEGSDYAFPGKNYALFTEHIFRPAEWLSIVPGVRWENIQTFADGYYKQRVTDFAGNIISDTNIRETRSDVRSFVLFGVGASIRPANGGFEIYANYSQNYRSITFSDIRVVNPNYAVDSNLHDERGFNADVGFRGNLAEGAVYFDATVFYLAYNDRIGLLLKADAPPLYLPYRFRTNIADSRTVGFEALAEADILALVRGSHREDESVSAFVNFSAINAHYINTDEPSIRDKEVEFVPPITLRTGVNIRWGQFRASGQVSTVARHYTDATNAVRTATAVNGEIPFYTVADFSLAYNLGDFTLETGANNLFDSQYFTRRAESYPGPGIIPSDGRSFYLTAQAQLRL